MATTLSFDMESPAWLRSLRWAAIFGMAACVFGARLYGVHAGWQWINIVLVVFAFWNYCLPMVEEHFFPNQNSKNFIFYQLLVDLLALTIVLWFSGGLVNPFVIFYIFDVMIAGLLLGSRFTGLIALFAAGAVLVLIFAPCFNVEGQNIQLKHSPIWIGVPLGLILLIACTNIFIWLFLERLRKAQDDHRRRTKMDALGRLVGGLAHEIGTPLNSILVIAKDLAHSLPEELRVDAETIHQQAKRCGDIVALLLGYSQGLARTDSLRYTRVNLRRWLDELHHSLSSRDSLHSTSSVDFQVDISGLPEEVDLPELILRQVLVNLFKNARDATEHEMHPQIKLHVFPDNVEKELCFTVQDNGPGFTKETQERAFEAFFTTKKQGDGAGLGLYISYYLLGQVGGRIVIEDPPDHGAMITIGIPYPHVNRSPTI